VKRVISSSPFEKPRAVGKTLFIWIRFNLTGIWSENGRLASSVTKMLRCLRRPKGIGFCLLWGACCSISTLNLDAQSQPPLASHPESTQETVQAGTSSIPVTTDLKSADPEGRPSGSATTTTESEKKKKTHRGTFVPAPLPIVSPAIGKGIIPGLGYIFPFSKNDKLSPPSVIGAAGMFTDNGSRGFGVGADVYMKEDTYEITAMYGRGNVNYNLYGSGIFSGLELPLEQSGHLFRGEFLRRLWWKFFIGPRFWSGQSFLTLRPNNGDIPPLPSGFGIHTTMRALGLRLMRDTRPNQFYPTSGEKIEFTSDFFMQSLGSKYSFQAYRFIFDKYFSLGKNQVLAYDLFACATGGQPPFYGNCVYGTSNELRGYTAGKYFDRYMAATQVEYRLTLPKGFGLAAFGGLGGVMPGSSQVLFRNDHFLPDIGGGPRYELSKKYHVNLRTDFAKGRGNWTWSMGVGEAF
jgi:Omp85 superfamily domain